MRIAAQGPTVRFSFYGYARGAGKRDEGGGVVKGNFGAAMERGAIQSRADEGGQGTASFPSADPPTREAADPNSLERKEGATRDGPSEESSFPSTTWLELTGAIPDASYTSSHVP